MRIAILEYISSNSDHKKNTNYRMIKENNPEFDDPLLVSELVTKSPPYDKSSEISEEY
jgi:hypothetical protein